MTWRIQSGWSDERVELLKKLWQDGLSASQIAKQLGGVSRSAVIGKARRLGLTAKDGHLRQAASAPARAASAPAPVKIANTRIYQMPASLPPTPRSSAAWAPIPGSHPIPFTERKAFRCTWPVDGGDLDQLSCNERTGGGTWCDHHAQIGYAKVQPPATVREPVPRRYGT